MDHDPRAYLWDVDQAARAIGTFTAGVDEAGYVGSPKAERRVPVAGAAGGPGKQRESPGSSPGVIRKPVSPAE